MWALISLCICGTIAGTSGRVPDDFIELMAKERFKQMCHLNGNDEAFESIGSAIKTMEECADEVDFVKTLRETYITTKSAAQWNNIFTNICDKLEVKKVCSEDFNKVAIQCMDAKQFETYAAVTNASIDTSKQVCSQLDDVSNFLMNNGWPCFAESVGIAVNCITDKRIQGKFITKEEMQTNGAACFKLIPCDEEKVTKLNEYFKSVFVN